MKDLKFHLTITDKETGKTVRDLDVGAVIGGILTADNTQGIILTGCNNFDLARTIIAAESSVSKVREMKDDEFDLLTSMLKLVTSEKLEDHSEKSEEGAEA